MAANPSPNALDDRKKLGELVVIVAKARHLTNIKLGKQSPYCKVIIGKESRKTAVVQRGGQHPEWDHQLEKFEIFEDMEDVVARTASGAGSDAVSADGSTPTKRKRKVFDKGVRTLRIECYADHPREPELIGSEVFDLAKVLNTGEDEDWVVIKKKDRYCGEIFLELTYFIAGAPPPPKPPVASGRASINYGGPGSFVSSSSTSTVSQSVSASNIANLYIPPYASGHPSRVTNNASLNPPPQGGGRIRRESFGGQTQTSYYPSLPSSTSHNSIDPRNRPLSVMSHSSSQTLDRPLPQPANGGFHHIQQDSASSSQTPPWAQQSQHGQEPTYSYPPEPSRTPLPQPPYQQSALYPAPAPASIAPTLYQGYVAGQAASQHQQQPPAPPFPHHSQSDPGTVDQQITHYSQQTSYDEQAVAPAPYDSSFSASLVPHRRSDGADMGRPLPSPADHQPRRGNSQPLPTYGYPPSTPAPQQYQEALPSQSYQPSASTQPYTYPVEPPYTGYQAPYNSSFSAPPPPPVPLPLAPTPAPSATQQWPAQQPSYLSQGTQHAPPSSNIYVQPYGSSDAWMQTAPPPLASYPSAGAYPPAPVEPYRHPSPSPYAPVPLQAQTSYHAPQPTYSLAPPLPPANPYQRSPSPAPPPPPPPPSQLPPSWLASPSPPQPLAGAYVSPPPASSWQQSQQQHQRW